MTGSELADALSASRSRAIAALGKAYVRRADDPDPEFFRGIMTRMGLDDDVAVSFLLASWDVLRAEKAAAPGEQQPAAAAHPQDVIGPDLKWTSGKHKGTLLSETPTDYLEWAAEKHPDPIARGSAAEELGRRAEGVPF